MRRIKATLFLALLTAVLTLGPTSGMLYGAVLTKTPAESFAFGVAATLVCVGFSGPAAIACGVAGAF
jgi:hypothetical protein